MPYDAVRQPCGRVIVAKGQSERYCACAVEPLSELSERILAWAPNFCGGRGARKLPAFRASSEPPPYHMLRRHQQPSRKLPKVSSAEDFLSGHDDPILLDSQVSASRAYRGLPHSDSVKGDASILRSEVSLEAGRSSNMAARAKTMARTEPRRLPSQHANTSGMYRGHSPPMSPPEVSRE
eukprot:gnl/TRDRNA2_/TRDRNA2_92262_c0_seq2.p1 gnl/TRDRNA2_/TRDRNA2_92262_c0~~gnl/TRDRNA2_/TRDRNA2_92262_c0_seq2.p1  ORF type:complete len:180 (+),score=10.92 gnl/TRDRNA2_/TRDRNA2_92262_c0_seq2:83-622(+)